MNRTLQDQLMAEIDRSGRASIRNLALAEAAVLRGQFNLAKRRLADDRGGERG
jgi:hypothetical protein